MNVCYPADLGAIDMPERKMLQQVFEGKYAQLFFYQIGTLGTNAFKIFYRTG